jgi:hypothetical protein
MSVQQAFLEQLQRFRSLKRSRASNSHIVIVFQTTESIVRVKAGNCLLLLASQLIFPTNKFELRSFNIYSCKCSFGGMYKPK